MRRALGPSAPNEVTYNTLLTACVRHGRVRLASRMLRALSGTHANGRSRPRANVWGYSTLLQGVATQARDREHSPSGALTRTRTAQSRRGRLQANLGWSCFRGTAVLSCSSTDA
eukprot:6192383-Pleurochrysis_carterae.AAC.1